MTISQSLSRFFNQKALPISNGVLAEILLAKKARKEIFYFKIAKPHLIVKVDSEEDIEMEQEVEQFKTLVFSK